MMDARWMVEGLQLTTLVGNDDDDDDNVTADTLPCGSSSKIVDVCYPKRRVCDAAAVATAAAAYTEHSAVDACRKLVVTLYAKVKACVVHIGGDFDATDDKQLAARAYFEYNQQYQLQRVALEKMRRNQRARPMFSPDGEDGGDWENEMGSHDGETTTSRAIAGIKTRVQAKQEADDIVQWFLKPRDTDDAMRTRKPISFRKSWIVV